MPGRVTLGEIYKEVDYYSGEWIGQLTIWETRSWDPAQRRQALLPGVKSTETDRMADET